MGLTVVIIKPEKYKIFGRWYLENNSSDYTLTEEIKHLYPLSEVEAYREVDRGFKLAQHDYELVRWGLRVGKILKS